MQRWKLMVPFAALATLALMLAAPGAAASPHVTLGEPHTTCDVDGSVELKNDPDNQEGGLDNEPSNNQYEFVQTELECDGQEAGTYNVAAEGTTDDFQHSGAGEDCAQGGSITASGDVHSGDLTATGPSNLSGSVHFVRLAEVVLADGPLTDGTNDYFFQAELVFSPQDGDCVNDPVNDADLFGTAEIYDASATHVSE